MVTARQIPACNHGRFRPQWRFWTAGALCAVSGLAVALACGAIWAPEALAAGFLTLAALTVSLLDAELSARVCLSLVGLLLAGYAFFGRSFAYLGLPPLYVGEMVLAVAALMVVANRSIARIRSIKLLWLWIAFAIWSAARTIPFIPHYGLDALRDAVVWGYGAFALIVLACLVTADARAVIVRWYGRLIPVFLLWCSFCALAAHVLPESLAWTGPSGISPLVLKPGDVAVHLSGIAAFLLMNPDGRSDASRIAWSKSWLLWVLLGCAILFYGSQNRGGLLAFLAAMVALVSFGRGRGWVKPLACGAALGLLLLFTGAELDLGRPRKVSPHQILENLQSITGGGHPLFEGTRHWRLSWWSRIVDYTIFGPYRWSGKGFGVNLADDDGFQTSPTHSLRSPHNVHLGILARAGLPGLALWLALQFTFGVALLNYIRRRCPAEPQGNMLATWVFVYWVAALINASFDVYLEGPAGGIWFWFVFGLGLSLMQQKRSACSAPAWRPGRQTCS